ncbi:hypothetical protein MRX96_037992 [Rhipicephalus microplus]
MDDLEERLTSRHKRVLQAKVLRLENSIQSMAKQMQQLQVQQHQPPGSSPTSPLDVEDNDLPGQPRDKEETAPAGNLERAAAQEAHTMGTTEQAGSTQLTTEGQSATTQIEDGVLR